MNSAPTITLTMGARANNRRNGICRNNDEVMVSTTVHDYDKRLESYRLLKEIWDKG